MSEERVFFKNKDGEKLAGVLHVPNKTTKKCVILCHGFTGTKEHWRILGHEFASSSIAAFRFDFSGSGESEGDFARTGYKKEVGDLKSAIDFVQAEGFECVGIVGHSFGGGVVVLASKEDKRIAAVVATAPTVFPTGKMLAGYAQERFKIDMDKSFYDDVKKVDVISAAKKRSCPLFIITGTADDVVPCDESKKLFEEAREPKELKLIGGANHDFAGFEHELISTVVAWMKKHL